MQELLLKMFESAKKDKRKLLALKNAAVKCQEFELAVQIRELEKELFPETDEEKEAKELAKNVKVILRLVEVNATEDACWLIAETLKKYFKIKRDFSVKEAAELIAERKRIFEIE